MKLRSGKKYISDLYSNYIDFDLASKVWRKNKIHMGYGIFVYK